MIQKITNLNLRPKTLRQNENKQQYNAGLTPGLKSGYDSFERSTAPAFTGKTNIKTYENVLSSLDANLNRVKNSLSEYAAENLPEKTWKRVLVAVGSLGLSEGIAHLSAKIRINKETGEILESMRQNQDTQGGIINSDISETNALTDWAIERMELEANHALAMDKIKREQIVPLFIAPVFNKTEVPNCLMISCGTENINKELIEWTKAESPCEIVTLNDDDDIVGALKAAEKHYKQTGERTLMHIENFDTLINPKTSDDETIGAMKSIMGDCANRYHTTILFSSQNPDELDRIATASHRVRRVEGNLKTMEEQLRDMAFEQLVQRETYTYPRKENGVHAGLGDLYRYTGIYNEIPPVGKAISPDDVAKLETRFAEVLPALFKSQILNFDAPHTKTTTPATFYVKAQDGTVKEYHGYKHTIKFDKNQRSYHAFRDNYEMYLSNNIEQSYFSLNKDLDIPVYAAWYRIFSNARPESISSPLLYELPHMLPEYGYSGPNGILDTDNMTTNIFLKMADEIFNENKDKYKTGIPEIDNIANVNNSPFSLRTMLHPTKYKMKEHKEYKTPDYKYNKEDLKSPEGGFLYLSYADITYALEKGRLPLHNGYFDNAIKYKLLPESKNSENEKDFILTVAEQQKLEKEKLAMHIVTASSKEEAERKFALDELRDKVWCVEHPEEALRKLLYVSGLDKQGITLRACPDNNEMSRVMRIVRDNLIELTKEDMKKIDYTGAYCLFKAIRRREMSGTLFGELPALILIANEHLIDRKEAPNPTKRKDLRTYREVENGYPLSYVWLNQTALRDVAAELEHYDYIKVASDVLKCISGKDTWYYLYGGWVSK